MLVRATGTYSLSRPTIPAFFRPAPRAPRHVRVRMKFRTLVAIGSIIAVSSLAIQLNHMSSLSAVTARNALNAAAFAGKRAVVVGGTSGIGQGIALRLAQANMKVTILGRDAVRGAQIVQQMRDAGGSEPEFMSCDCFSLENVRKCSRDILAKNDSLSMLVLTQGMATIQGFTPTAEGLDQKLTLHYFSRVAFIQSLLPALRNSADARVLSVLSAGVHGAYEGYSSDFTLEDTYSIKNAADAAGLYNDVALDALSRENPSISFQHAAPGFVDATRVRFADDAQVRCLQVFGKSIADCAEFMCLNLFEAKASVQGFKLYNQAGAPASTTALHDAAREQVWSRTKEILSRQN